MPHAVYNLGNLAATADLQPRHLIPGIEPGGSRAGAPVKPALLIRDAWIVFNNTVNVGSTNPDGLVYSLKLSQEIDLNPGLLLRVGHASVMGDGTNSLSLDVCQDFKAQGTVWAASYVGVRVLENGAADIDCDLHLDYERVDVPWMDWFIMWDFLDNVVDNEEQY